MGRGRGEGGGMTEVPRRRRRGVERLLTGRIRTTTAGGRGAEGLLTGRIRTGTAGWGAEGLLTGRILTGTAGPGAEGPSQTRTSSSLTPPQTLKRGSEAGCS